MANYKISGVWKNHENVITHYAIHKVNTENVDRATKMSKADAVKLLDTPGNSAMTWLWNYSTCKWSNGETVSVINSPNGKFLRSNPDSRLTDNLAHLIDYDWIAP